MLQYYYSLPNQGVVKPKVQKQGWLRTTTDETTKLLYLND